MHHHLFDPHPVGDIVHPDDGAQGAVGDQRIDHDIGVMQLAILLERQALAAHGGMIADGFLDPLQLRLQIGQDFGKQPSFGFALGDADRLFRPLIPLVIRPSISTPTRTEGIESMMFFR